MNTEYKNFNEKNNHEENRLVRSKTCDTLNLLRKSLKNFESSYRQEFLPPPTRQKPFPDKKATDFLAKLRKFELRIESLETSIRGADSSLDDKNWNKNHDKTQTLLSLSQIDEIMMGDIDNFYQSLKHTINEHNILEVENFLNDFEKYLRKRQDYLRVQIEDQKINF